MTRGRPRKLDVPRDSKGRIASGYDRQSPEAIKAVAEEARIRQLLGVDTFLAVRRDEKKLLATRKKVSGQLQGYALGILCYTRQISRDQHDAGFWFAELYYDMASIRGWPLPKIKALDYGAIPGRSTAPERSQHWSDRRKEEWERAYTALYYANEDQGRTGRDIFEILKRTLVEDIGPLNAYELGNLRVGLNAIKQAGGV